MSALSVFVSADAVWLFTDGVINTLEPPIIVVGITGKVVPLPHLNAVVSATGHVIAAQAIAGVLGATPIRDFDDAALQFGAAARRVSDGLLAAYSTSTVEQRQFRAVLAGWSDATQSAQAFVVGNFDEPDDHGGGWAFQPTPVDKMISPPFEGATSITIDDSNAETAGLDLLEQQRRHVTALGGMHDEGQSLVGGFAQLTRVSRDGIQIRALRRWPDKVGEKINPSMPELAAGQS